MKQCLCYFSKRCYNVLYLLWSKAGCGLGNVFEKKEGQCLAVLSLSVHCVPDVEHFLLQNVVQVMVIFDLS